MSGPRNPAAAFSFLVALLALGILAGGVYVAQTRVEVSWLEASAAVPIGGFLGLFALALAARGRALHQRTLGRSGGEFPARLGRGLGLLALLLTATAILALAVFGVLVATDGLTQLPW
jgi:hypothetical protein